MQIENYKTKLMRRGFKKIGEGMYAEIWSRSDVDFVIKIFQYDDDVAYYSYLCKINQKENQKNPYFPKVKKIKRFKDQYKSKWCIVKLEKLEEGCFDNKNENIKTLQKTLKTKKIDYFNEIIEKFVITHKRKTNLYKALKIIVDLKNQVYGISMDCHNNNIMLRQTKNKKQLVFTDPLSKI